MEVVISPGRFGDEAPGAPFQNEEIREWSHVDRLTGMLERARVETGRWQTSNQGAAKSYGKVIDSRERNSADGSIVQRARRQVEIFQSQGRGRTVQVVRASQWSSSRVTDSISTNPSTLPVLNKKEEEEKIVIPSRVEGDMECASRENAISERLSSLLGSLNYPASSTVPLRRIDSKYSSRAGILKNTKRSNSNEDLAVMSREKDFPPRVNSYPMAGYRFSEGKKNIDEVEKFKKIAEGAREDSEQISTIVRREEQPRATKSAIHLLPSSKSNTTVVNLIKDSRPKKEILDFNRPIVSWTSTASSNVRENRSIDPEHCVSRRDNKIEDLTNFSTSGKMPKRVGFCKTEIHFAADSGKVNIVETDEKPPPTNKFRRRRRLTGITNNKNIPNVNSSTYEMKIHENPENSTCERFQPEENTRNDHQRGHTTTVKLGSEISKNEERGAHEASSQGILLRFENRIYDRLETCTSDISSNLDCSNVLRLETSAGLDIQASALKSTRLVMDLTRNSNTSRIIADTEISRIPDEGEFFHVEELEDYSTGKNQEDSTSLYLDWENDNEVKSIMLGLHNENMYSEQERNLVSREFVTRTLSKEPENIPENNESLLIGMEEIEKKASTTVEKNSSPHVGARKNSSAENYDVVCADADNNQVVLKVVTIHEPTIARVENDDLRKKMKKPTCHRKISKTIASTKKSPQIEHTYVNVFGVSERAPLYENYEISDKNSPTNREKIIDPIKKEAKSLLEKVSRVSEATNQTPSSNINSSVSRKVETLNLEKIDPTVVAESMKKPGFSRDSSIVGQKFRSTTIEDKLVGSNDKSSRKLSSSNSTDDSPGTSRLKTTSKSLKNSSTGRVPIKSQNPLISSIERDSRASSDNSNRNERDSRLSTGNLNRNERCVPSKPSSREISSTRMRKSENRQKPMEVVYQTAVYNMKNEKLSKPQKGKESKGPRYLNELICGAKTKRVSDSKNKSSNTIQHSAKSKGASPMVRHWK